MTRRKQNLVLFFEEKMEKISINNRLVRSHMNHLTIGEIAEIEIIAAYNIHENEQIEPLAQEAVEISKSDLSEINFQKKKNQILCSSSRLFLLNFGLRA